MNNIGEKIFKGDDRSFVQNGLVNEYLPFFPRGDKNFASEMRKCRGGGISPDLEVSILANVTTTWCGHRSINPPLFVDSLGVGIYFV